MAIDELAQKEQRVRRQRDDLETGKIDPSSAGNCSRRSSSHPVSTQQLSSIDHLQTLFTHAYGAPMNVRRRLVMLDLSAGEYVQTTVECSFSRVSNDQPMPVDERLATRPATSTNVVSHARPTVPRRSPDRRGESSTAG